MCIGAFSYSPVGQAGCHGCNFIDVDGPDAATKYDDMQMF